jgi:hypothetical protein
VEQRHCIMRLYLLSRHQLSQQIIIHQVFYKEIQRRLDCHTAYVVDKTEIEQTIAVSITQDATPTVTASAQCLGTGTYHYGY